ncbi:hypothetical protein [Anaerosporobacter faecicola]|uniref:hypothetical protein n=1 Tax=Anaerosporobacter faecicola TaxID=2718714 RepID=UPI001439B4C8|nr:hypothetical protein [Anaerosporobacter faecicola]
MLSECDFQWIWAVFSAIPEKISNEEVLKYSLPYAAENEEIYKDDVAIIQHPLADFEIVAEDSSSVFIVSKDKQILSNKIKSKRVFLIVAKELSTILLKLILIPNR